MGSGFHCLRSFSLSFLLCPDVHSSNSICGKLKKDGLPKLFLLPHCLFSAPKPKLKPLLSWAANFCIETQLGPSTPKKPSKRTPLEPRERLNTCLLQQLTRSIPAHTVDNMHSSLQASVWCLRISTRFSTQAVYVLTCLHIRVWVPSTSICMHSIYTVHSIL